MRPRDFLADPTVEIGKFSEDGLRDFVKDLAAIAASVCPNLPEQPPMPDWRLEFSDAQIQRDYDGVNTGHDRIGASTEVIKKPQTRLLAFWQRNASAKTKSGKPAGSWATRDLGMIAWDTLAASTLGSDESVTRVTLTNYMRAIEILASKDWKLPSQRTLAAHGIERYGAIGGSIELLAMLAVVSGSAEVQSLRLRVKRELKGSSIRQASGAEVAAAKEFLRKLG